MCFAHRYLGYCFLSQYFVPELLQPQCSRDAVFRCFSVPVHPRERRRINKRQMRSPARLQEETARKKKQMKEKANRAICSALFMGNLKPIHSDPRRIHIAATRSKSQNAKQAQGPALRCLDCLEPAAKRQLDGWLNDSMNERDAAQAATVSGTVHVQSVNQPSAPPASRPAATQRLATPTAPPRPAPKQPKTAGGARNNMHCARPWCETRAARLQAALGP